MASIGEQIKNARQGKGMTQDDLAEKLHVTRSAVANWEQSRRLPDAETMLRLSSVLEYSFESSGPIQAAETAADGDAAETAAEGKTAAGAEQPAEAAEPAAAEHAGQEAQKAAKPSRGKLYAIIGVALVAVALLVWLVIVPMLKPAAPAPVAYQSVDGTVYTMEQFAKAADNDPSKAYLLATTTLGTMQAEERTLWTFTFDFKETNGIGVTIDTVEAVIFGVPPHENLQFVTDKKAMEEGGKEYVLPANCESWTYDGALPVQDTMYGIGLLLSCTDENGASLRFPAFIRFQ